MEEKYLKYFNENAYEDQEAIIAICEVASKNIKDKFRMTFDDPKLLASMFASIYNTILDKLVSFEKEYSDFEIKIANRLSIGYSNYLSDDDEKKGNFLVFIKNIDDINGSVTNTSNMDYDSTGKERAVQWNTENITVQVDLIRDISIAAAKNLEAIDVRLASSEVIMPIFVMVYEALVNYIKIVRRERELFEYEINFMSCFYIAVMESEDGNDPIRIRPNIESKLRLKNDFLATSKYE